VVIVALVVVSGVIALVAGVAMARRRRRAVRRSAADPAHRVLGAWRELLDSLRPFRVPVTSLTPAEVSTVAGELAPPAGEASRQLAELVDQAVYAGVANDESAALAWAASDQAVQALAQATPGGQRVRYLLAGAALLGRR
jgi:hypothetical protein